MNQRVRSCGKVLSPGENPAPLVFWRPQDQALRLPPSLPLSTLSSSSSSTFRPPRSPAASVCTNPRQGCSEDPKHHPKGGAKAHTRCQGRCVLVKWAKSDGRPLMQMLLCVECCWFPLSSQFPEKACMNQVTGGAVGAWEDSGTSTF